MIEDKLIKVKFIDGQLNVIDTTNLNGSELIQVMEMLKSLRKEEKWDLKRMSSVQKQSHKS